MTKFIWYGKPTNEVKDIEIQVEGSLSFYSLRTRKIDDKIIIEYINSPEGKIATAKELVRDTKLTLQEVKSKIIEAHAKKD